MKVLAERGTEGERKAAKAILDKLLKKYDLDDELFDDEEPTDYLFTFHGAEEGSLLCQVAYKVTGVADNVYKVRNRKNHFLRTKYAIVCTLAQKVEIEFLFGFYARLFKQERKLFLAAFIQKHRIFADTILPEEKINKRNSAELMRMVEMMKGMSDAEPYKALENKEECNNE